MEITYAVLVFLLVIAIVGKHTSCLFNNDYCFIAFAVVFD